MVVSCVSKCMVETSVSGSVGVTEKGTWESPAIQHITGIY